MHSEKHRYWKCHHRDLRLQSDEPSPCSPQFSTIVLSSWMFPRTECRCLTEEHKTSPIMGDMRHHHDSTPWFYFHTPQHLFSDLMWNLNIFYLIFHVAVPFPLGFSKWLSCIDGKTANQKIAIILQFTGNWGKAAGNCSKERKSSFQGFWDFHWLEGYLLIHNNDDTHSSLSGTVNLDQLCLPRSSNPPSSTRSLLCWGNLVDIFLRFSLIVSDFISCQKPFKEIMFIIIIHGL